MIDRGSANPFIRYRSHLDVYAAARAAGWSDDDFVALVHRLDDHVAAVEGHGFSVTPLSDQPSLAAATGAARVWVKDDSGNVGGSHKARHLFGVMLALAVDGDDGSELAIASCGNAALAAAVVARAEERPLRVFIPTWADAAVVERLAGLDARIEVCERRPGESGDPTYLRFLEAVDEGATPFSVQGTITHRTIDGGRTLGWEAAEQLADAGASGPLHVFLQVGGGALGTAVAQAFGTAIASGWIDVDPAYHPVQTEACAPFRRAWLLAMDAAGSDDPVDLAGRGELLGGVLAHLDERPDAFMWPWDPVGTSAASGILDDVVYDWRVLLEETLRSGGWPVVVSEERVLEAHRLGREATGIDVCATGTAGLAGLLETAVEHPALVFFTGVQRS
ncbi:MAG TPA: pyridoxal-phosphate dependent enzyme [Acidimicrobiia bacterium]|nr:pyridoxal-phosphate dependent enzyme [Acidimicrobiia bacterium]